MKVKKASKPITLVRSPSKPWDWVATHLGDRSVFGLPMFIAYLLLSEIMRLAIFGLSIYTSFSDVVTDWSWILLSRATIYFGLARLINLIPRRLRTPGVNLISAASLSVFSLTADYFLYPQDSQIFRYGFLPTVEYMAALTVVAYSLYAPVIVDLRQYRQGASALAEAQAGLKANLEEIAFKSELAEQIRRSQLEAIVIPQITRLRDSLGKGSKSAAASIEKIRDIIETNVRPLSRDLLVTRAQLRPVKISRPVSSVLGAFFYKRPLVEAYRPIVWLVILSPIYVIGDMAVYGPGVFWVSLGSNIIWALTILGIAFLIPSKLKVNGFAAAFATGFTAFVVWLPIDWQIAMEMGDVSTIQVISVASLANSFGLVFLMTLSREISNALADVIASKNAQSAELKAKIEDFNRSEWIHQRNWSYLLHGKIQAGLSVALIKLSQLDDAALNLSAGQKKAVVKDVVKIIDEVMQTLQNPKVMEVDLYSSLKQQTELWQGVCEIKVSLPEAVETLLAADVEARFALNEMACEAVVNAVKHAGAKSLQLSFTHYENNIVELKAVNDGKAPSQDSKKSLGSALLDDLTQSWTLTRTGKKTVLAAKVKVASQEMRLA